jgi:hypothetical protein
MKMQPSQLAPVYPFHFVGNADATLSGLGELWGGWNPQVQPLPCLFPIMMLPANWFPVEQDRVLDLATYVEGAAGTPADLDQALEAATIEYLMQDDQTERQ